MSGGASPSAAEGRLGEHVSHHGHKRFPSHVHHARTHSHAHHHRRKLTRVASSQRRSLAFLELLLQRFPTLTSASPDALDELARQTKRVTYQRNEVLVAEGETSSCIWIVQSGEFSLTRTSQNAFDAKGQKLSLVIASIGAGEELGLICAMKAAQERLKFNEKQDSEGNDDSGHGHAGSHGHHLGHGLNHSHSHGHHYHHHSHSSFNGQPLPMPVFTPHDFTVKCSHNGSVFALPLHPLFEVLLASKPALVRHVLTDIALHHALHLKRYHCTENYKSDQRVHQAVYVQAMVQQAQLTGSKQSHRLHKEISKATLTAHAAVISLTEAEDRAMTITEPLDEQSEAEAAEQQQRKTRERARRALIEKIHSSTGRTFDQTNQIGAVIASVKHDETQKASQQTESRKRWETEPSSIVLASDEEESEEAKAMRTWLKEREKKLNVRHAMQQPKKLTEEQLRQQEHEQFRHGTQRCAEEVMEEIEDSEINDSTDNASGVAVDPLALPAPGLASSSLASPHSALSSHRRPLTMTNATVELINRIAYANRLAHIVHPKAQRPSTNSTAHAGNEDFSVGLRQWKEPDWPKPKLSVNTSNKTSSDVKNAQLYSRVVLHPEIDARLSEATSAINEPDSAKSPSSATLSSVVRSRGHSSQGIRGSILFSPMSQRHFVATLPDGSINPELIRSIELGVDVMRLDEDPNDNNHDSSKHSSHALRSSPFPPTSFFQTENQGVDGLDDDQASMLSVSQANNARRLGYTYMGLRARHSSLASAAGQSASQNLDQIKAKRAKAAAAILERNGRALLKAGVVGENGSSLLTATDPLALAALLNDSSASEKLVGAADTMQKEDRVQSSLQQAAIEREKKEAAEAITQHATDYLQSLFEAEGLDSVQEVAEILTREKLGVEASAAFDHAVSTGGLLPTYVQRQLSDAVKLVGKDLKQVEEMREEWRREATETKHKRMKTLQLARQQQTAEPVSDSDSGSEFDDTSASDNDDDVNVGSASRFAALHTMLATSATEAEEMRESNNDESEQSATAILTPIELPHRESGITAGQLIAELEEHETQQREDAENVNSSAEPTSRSDAQAPEQSIEDIDSEMQSIDDDSQTAMLDVPRSHTAPIRFITTPNFGDLTGSTLPTPVPKGFALPSRVTPAITEAANVTINMAAAENEDEKGMKSVHSEQSSQRSGTSESNSTDILIVHGISGEPAAEDAEELDESRPESATASSAVAESDTVGAVGAADGSELEESNEPASHQSTTSELSAPLIARSQTVVASEPIAEDPTSKPSSAGSAVVDRDFLLGTDIAIIRTQVQINIEHETAKLKSILEQEAAERREQERRAKEQEALVEKKRQQLEELKEREAEKERARKSRDDAEQEADDRMQVKIDAAERALEPSVDALSAFHSTVPTAASALPPVKKFKHMSVKSIDETKLKAAGAEKMLKSKDRSRVDEFMAMKPSTAPSGNRKPPKKKVQQHTVAFVIPPGPKKPGDSDSDSGTEEPLTLDDRVEAIFADGVRSSLMKKALDAAIDAADQKHKLATAKRSSLTLATNRPTPIATTADALAPPAATTPTGSSPTSQFRAVENEAAATRARITQLEQEHDQRRSQEMEQRALEAARVEKERQIAREIKARKKDEKTKKRQLRREQRQSAILSQQNLARIHAVAAPITPASILSPTSTAQPHSNPLQSPTQLQAAATSRPTTQTQWPEDIDEQKEQETSPPSTAPYEESSSHKHSKRHRRRSMHSRSSKRSVESREAPPSSSDSELEADDTKKADEDLHAMAVGRRAKIKVEEDWGDFDPAARSHSLNMQHFLPASMLDDFDCTVLIEDSVQREVSAVFDDRCGGLMPKNFFTYEFASNAPSIHPAAIFEFDDDPLRAKQRAKEARGLEEREELDEAEKQIRELLDRRGSAKAYATRSKEVAENEKKLVEKKKKREEQQQAVRQSLLATMMGVSPIMEASPVQPPLEPIVPLTDPQLELNNAQARQLQLDEQRKLHEALLQEAKQWNAERTMILEAMTEEKQSLSTDTDRELQSLSASASTRLSMASLSHSQRADLMAAKDAAVRQEMDAVIESELHLIDEQTSRSSTASFFPPINRTAHSSAATKRKASPRQSSPVTATTRASLASTSMSSSSFNLGAIPASNQRIAPMGASPFTSKRHSKPPALIEPLANRAK